jgi:hypothetical protein
MTRYETAVATFSMWLTKARTPHDAQPLSLHLRSKRRDVASPAAGPSNEAETEAARPTDQLKTSGTP